MADEKNTQGPTMTHPQCINRLRDIERALAEITELEAPSQEDEKYFNELTEEFREVDNYRRQLERKAQLAKVQSVSETLSGAKYLKLERGVREAQKSASDDYDRDAIMNPDSIEECRFRNPWDLQSLRTFDRPRREVATELRSRAISAIEKMSGTSDTVRNAATNMLEAWGDTNGRMAEYVLTTSDPTYLRAWSKLARNPLSPDLTEEERRAVARTEDLKRGMSLTDSAGGYLVPFQLDPTVILTANGSRNEIRRYARQVVATGDIWNGISAGAVSWSYDAEGSEVSDDAPTFASPAIPIYTARGFVPITMEAFQDAANVTQTVGTLLAEGKDILEANAFVLGSGSGMPTGIVTALTGGASEVASATSDTFAVADVYNLLAALPARYRSAPNTAWLANNLIYQKVRQFDTNGGSALWATIGNDRPAQLLGKPIMEAEDMDGTVTASAANYLAIVGDWSNYVIADRIGMTVDFVPHLFGTNHRPTGGRGWFATVRHGADSVNDAAFRMLNA